VHAAAENAAVIWKEQKDTSVPGMLLVLVVQVSAMVAVSLTPSVRG